MTETTLAELFRLQHELQTESFGLDPMKLEGEDRTRFILWNAYALADELHELPAEVGWKPWATSRHVNEGAATREGVDLLHFWMNIMMAVAPSWCDTPEMAAEHAAVEYAAKRAANAKRQEDGYDGVNGKCPSCKRDETEATETLIGGNPESEPQWMCPCGYVWPAP